ncbi:MAG: hypothetical protein KatS3mg068_1066 [Candidatus Sericytochromatia bacterium]|nr:MAG: hypothetical protein KatS3mg068_1066 [Candidatus Sericytochromatia bacterium]
MLSFFEEIIKPCTFTQFKDNFLLKRCFLGNYNLQFYWENVNNIINTKKVPPYDINLIFDDYKRINPNSLFEIHKHLVSQGHVVIYNIHKYESKLREFILKIIDDLKCRITTSLLIKLNKNSYFNFQYENKDILFFVLEGYFNLKVNSTLESNEFKLNKNDFIYIPMNSNYTIVSDVKALGLNVEIEYNNANSFLEWFLNNIIVNDNDFIDTLPLNLTFQQETNKELNIDPNWVNIIEKLKEKLLNKLDDPSLFDEYYNYLIKTQEGEKCCKFPFIFMNNIIGIEDKFNLLRKDYMDSVFEYKEENLIIYFWKKYISIDVKYSKLAEFIFKKANKFNLQDLYKIDNNLTKNDVVLLLNYLIKNNIIEIENDNYK